MVVPPRTAFVMLAVEDVDKTASPLIIEQRPFESPFFLVSVSVHAPSSYTIAVDCFAEAARADPCYPG